MFANGGPFIISSHGEGGGSGPSANAVIKNPSSQQDIKATTSQFPLTITTTGTPTGGQAFNLVPLVDAELTLSNTLPAEGLYASMYVGLVADSSVSFDVAGNSFYGGYWEVQIDSNNPLNGSVVSGNVGYALYNGTYANNADGSLVQGVDAEAANLNSGNPNNLRGLYILASQYGSGTIPVVAGIYVDSPGGGAGAGNITFNSAIYINDQSSAASGSTIAATWGIYEISVTERNALGSINLGGASGPLLSTGTGSPEGAVTATPGSLYLNQSGGSGTTLYVKESGSGNTGWVGK